MKNALLLTKLLLVSFVILFPGIKSFGQNTGISDVANTPVSSAVLDVYSTSKGFLVPRLTQAQKTAVSSPATGLLIYQTNGAAGFYYYDGTMWVPFTTGSTGWLLDGNSVTATKTLGTITNYDLPIITNNTEKMRVTVTGSVGIGSISFNALNPERLLVDYGTTTSTTLATFRGRINNYLQINVQNTSDGADASTDIVATANNGTDSTYYIDMGINSSNYLPSVDNFGGPNDGYLYTNSRHLILGTQATNSDIAFLVSGGQLSVNQAMRIDGASKNIIIGRRDNSSLPTGNTVRGPNGLGTNISGGSLSFLGGSATGTGIGGAINITGGTTVSGTGGAVNINAGTNNAANINTGANNQNVTIGSSSNNIIIPKWTVPGGVYYNTNASGQLGDASLLIWDNANTYLGINTASPTQRLETMNGNIAISNNNNAAGELRFLEPSFSGSNYTSFKAPDQTANIIYTLPPTQGNVNARLTNDGLGNLSWTDGTLAGSVSIFTKKTVDESVVNSALLQDDNDFTFPFIANRTYEIFLMLKVHCSNGGKIKMKMVSPVGSSAFIGALTTRGGNGAVTYMPSVTTAYTIAAGALNENSDMIIITGTITTAAAGGTFRVQWAQATSDSDPTTIFAGSYCKATVMQ